MHCKAKRQQFASHRSASWLPKHPRQNTTSPMRNLMAVLWASVALLFVARTIQAWSRAGYQVLAAEAYRQLSTDLQKRATEILKAHPDYEKWKESFTGEAANLDLTFLFAKAGGIAIV